ncbi:MAG TPA: ABC transporter ATP-binding protein [Euryarchaeota archaeon]|nr:putative siderophore transport system ATP-binding protein YusV [archaeon BMS3Bbin16]HDH28710.1 ABC transporter ATP-binding protein [Euryarchaeota archaeon]
MKIAAKDLEVCYGENLILKGISLAPREGSLLGVIGPNGSGKTTLLKTLSNILKPISGVVYLNGSEIGSLTSRETARNLAVVPQDTGVGFDFTAYELVLMGRTPHIGRFEKESRTDRNIAADAMRLTHTEDLKDRLVTTLSGGERQKVVIAKALSQEPNVLLLDEPTANLDIKNQLEVMGLIKNAVIGRGITAIMAIHDINLAARYCDEMMLLRLGEIYASGPPKAVLTKENIKAVFGVESLVTDGPEDGSVYVIPLSTLEKEEQTG